MPAAKPTKKTIRTRTTPDEANLPSHDPAIMIRFRTVELVEDSLAARPFENSDSDDGWPDIIGIPPLYAP
jgi:hypothetical protein